MKVPKYIKAKMHKVAELQAKSTEEMTIIEDWLENHGIDTSFESGRLRDGSGCSLEELEYGNDITEELCLRIEQMIPKLPKTKRGDEGNERVEKKLY